jgi:hypothetical protein
VCASQVLVTHGCMFSMASALMATVAPGDEVLIPDPGFPNCESCKASCTLLPSQPNKHPHAICLNIQAPPCQTSPVRGWGGGGQCRTHTSDLNVPFYHHMLTQTTTTSTTTVSGTSITSSPAPLPSPLIKITSTTHHRLNALVVNPAPTTASTISS